MEDGAVGNDESVSPLRGAFVVLGVTGGIAAYKAIELCRGLVDAGAHVAPVLTSAAEHFVGVATFNALASEHAHTSLFSDDDPIPHTRLGQAADLVVIAPATARLIGSYAAGISDDLLTATLLATNAPVVLAPAMHTEMWQHDAVQENLATLVRRGVHVVSPERGRLAGGDVGEGRLADPQSILLRCAQVLESAGDLRGVTVLVTAGGTREPIDPVRFIANRSSGKQGYALADVARRRGATVTLVTTVERDVPAGVGVVFVETAAEMKAAVLERQDECDVVIMAAAVADFRPSSPSKRKLKRAEGIPTIELEATDDVLSSLVARRRPGQVIVGFAAETDDPLENATSKLKDKDVDLLVVNDVSKAGVGFAHDTNAVSILSRTGARIDVPLGPKTTIGAAVLDAVLELRASGDASKH